MLRGEKMRIVPDGIAWLFAVADEMSWGSMEVLLLLSVGGKGR